MQDPIVPLRPPEETGEINQSVDRQEEKIETTKEEPEIVEAEEVKVDALAEFRDEKGRFMPGRPPGPGRTVGRRDFTTLFNEALEKIAQAETINIPDAEKEMVIKGIAEALKGSFPHLKFLLEMKYGRAKEKLELGYEKESLDNIAEFLRNLAKPKEE